MGGYGYWRFYSLYHVIDVIITKILMDTHTPDWTSLFHWDYGMILPPVLFNRIDRKFWSIRSKFRSIRIYFFIVFNFLFQFFDFRKNLKSTLIKWRNICHLPIWMFFRLGRSIFRFNRFVRFFIFFIKIHLFVILKCYIEFFDYRNILSS